MLPHIKNSQAGINLYDPVFKQIFEVEFDLPAAIAAEFGGDRTLLTEHVLSVSFGDAFERAPETDQQKFMGTSRSFIKPHIEDTSAEITVNFTLNLRNGVDNYIYKVLRAWSRLGYNIDTGERHLKKDYCAQWLKIRVANQAGDVYRDIAFKDVMMKGPIGSLGEYAYDSDDALTLEVKFVSDWWTDVEA